jgi:hypothetical protein
VVVSEPRPLIFTDGWADTVFDGVPLTESVLGAFVGRCQGCGRAAGRQHDGSVLTNVLVVDGTLYGDTYCTSCFDDEAAEGPVFFLPPLDQESRSS